MVVKDDFLCYDKRNLRKHSNYGMGLFVNH